MGLHINPISDYTGEEKDIDVDGIIRRIDRTKNTLTVVDPTGSIEFNFADSWSTDVSVGDYVQVRGLYDEDKDWYSIVGMKAIDWDKMSNWAKAEGKLSSFHSPTVLKVLDAANLIAVSREKVPVKYGAEVYCCVNLKWAGFNKEIARVPETYLFTWELDELDDESKLYDIADAPCFRQIFNNACYFGI